MTILKHHYWTISREATPLPLYISPQGSRWKLLRRAAIPPCAHAVGRAGGVHCQIKDMGKTAVDEKIDTAVCTPLHESSGRDYAGSLPEDSVDGVRQDARLIRVEIDWSTSGNNFSPAGVMCRSRRESGRQP